MAYARPGRGAAVGNRARDALRMPLALLGIAHRHLGRWSAVRAYAGVMRKAFTRWSGA